MKLWSILPRRVALFGGLLLAACATGTTAGRAPGGRQVISAYPPRDLSSARPLTRPERTGFRETSTHADVVAFLDTLKTLSKDLHVGTFGRSPGGRDIPMAILSRPVVRTAAEAKRLHRPIVFLQGNIHGGEVEGKEALMSVLRDLARDRYLNVVDSLVIVVVPIYNADGNDSLGPQDRNRRSQNGPAMIGQRSNGQGLDLNRDYVKAEAPETRASLDFFREWEPDVFVDLHTTNGSYHGYALTYAPSLTPAARFAGPYTRDTVLPALRESLRQNLRIETYPYGNFASQDSVARGWFTYDHRPRYGVNYYGLRGRVSILGEAYSHDPFQKRIATTYAFVMELLSLVAKDAEDFLDVGREADRRTTAFATTPNSSPFVPIRSRLTRAPRMDDVLVEAIERTGDTVRHEPGMPRGVRRTGRVAGVRIPVYDRFEPALQRVLPYAWTIPREQAALLEPLRRHGLFIEELATDARVIVERFTVDSAVQVPRSFDGPQEVRVAGRWATDSATIPAGTYVVRGGQPLGILALYLLDPESDDGLATWNFLAPWLRSGERYPIDRVMNRIVAPLRAVGK
jgi:hypothetical protein